MRDDLAIHKKWEQTANPFMITDKGPFTYLVMGGYYMYIDYIWS